MTLDGSKARIVDLMRSTGAPCVVSGVKVKRHTERRNGWFRSAVYPLFSMQPEAYRVMVAGQRVNARAALALLISGALEYNRRHWRIRVRMRLAPDAAVAAALLPVDGHVAVIMAAADTAALEAAFQVARKVFPSRVGRDTREHERIVKAMRQRGLQLINAHPRGSLVPQFAARRRMTVAGQVYNVGFGGNGTGERWVWHSAKCFATAVLRKEGLDDDTAKTVWDWSGDYPHRALEALYSK